MATLSVIIITKNAERHVKRSLESCKWADEIIIIDSGSTDQTLDIASQYTQNITQTDWPGFGPQKNRALAKATGDWVLSLDADEYLSDELKSEIQQAINLNNTDAYSIPRRSKYCGHTIRFGDWRNDNVVRLFKRGCASFSNDLVHEKLLVTGTIKKLNNHLYHEAFSSLEEVLNKMNQYSTLGAEMRFKKGQTASLSKAISHSLWTFIRGYFFRLGFLDGKAGYMLAISNAQGCYYRYLKLALAKENI